MRVVCKKQELGQQRKASEDDDVRLEHTKTWSLEDHCPRAVSLGVDAQFVVTKHHAYCVVAARG